MQCGQASDGFSAGFPVSPDAFVRVPGPDGYGETWSRNVGSGLGPQWTPQCAGLTDRESGLTYGCMLLSEAGWSRATQQRWKAW